MTEILQPDDSCPADAWIEPVSVKHKIDHNDIERMTAAFLAGGGRVEVFEPGCRAVDSHFNNRLVRTGDVNPYLLPDQRAHRDRIHQGDSDLVAHIAVQLPTQPRKDTLLAELQCGDWKLQRLLRMYFRDDREADYLRSGKDRIVRNRQGQTNVSTERRIELNHQLRQYDHDDIARRIREHSHLCAAQIARVLAVDENLVRRVIAEYGIQVRRYRTKSQEAA